MDGKTHLTWSNVGIGFGFIASICFKLLRSLQSADGVLASFRLKLLFINVHTRRMRLPGL